MKLLVTGGAGFVGSHFVERSCHENEITVIDDLSNGSLANIKEVRRRIRLMKTDVSKPTVVRLRGVGKVDGIIHLACHPRSFSFKNPTRDVEVNVRATMNVLELARRHDAKLVFTSNSGIYGDPQYLPMDEQHPINCKTPYDVNKYASELQMRTYRMQYGLRTVVCRLATVYGPHQRVNEKLGWRPVVATFLEYLTQGRRPVVFGDGNQTRDLIYVKDVADGLLKAFNSTKSDGEVFNLSTSKETSINNLLRMITDKLGLTVEAEHGPPSVGDLRRMCCSNEKARTVFGFEIKYPLREALEEYVKWYKQNQKTRRIIKH
ncbi:MAG: NAD-dependent epimerase/dehydratase family protein [Candidatus Bathyarchaeia archaeon]